MLGYCKVGQLKKLGSPTPRQNQKRNFHIKKDTAQLFHNNSPSKKQNLILPVQTIRYFSSEGEQRIKNLLQENLKPQELEVVDISGGCGSMYKISVASDLFQGMSTLQQHKKVNEILKDEIKKMHGLTISTKIPVKN